MQKAKEFDWKDSNVALIGTSQDRALKKESALTEPAWQPILKCTSPTLFIYRINNFKVEALPKEDYGSFYNGDSYIVLNVYKQEDKLEYDVHFWIGKYSTQDEYGTAAYKVVELDNLLDDRAIQHREVEGHESALFKSYFKEMRILQGGVASGFRHVTPEEYKPRLMHFCQKGNRIEIKEVQFSQKSLNSGDVYILDFGKTAIQWNGKSCNPMEKMSAAQFLRKLNSERNGRVKTEVVDEIDAKENEIFLSHLPNDEISTNQKLLDAMPKKLYKLSDESGEMKFTCISENGAPHGQICEEDVFFVQGSSEVFVYIGNMCSIEERKNALIYGCNMLNTTNVPWLPLTVVTQDTAEKRGMNKILD